jgi:hypothetical protein
MKKSELEVHFTIGGTRPIVMYARFTDRARKVMQLATQEALRLNDQYVGTEHILLGLIREGSGLAASVRSGLPKRTVLAVHSVTE